MAMAESAAGTVARRTSERRQRRAPVDSRQLAFAWEPTPHDDPIIATESLATMEPRSVPIGDAFAPIQTACLATQAAEATAAICEHTGETEALSAIVDLLLDLWKDATGEDLRPSIFNAQNE